MTMQKLTPFALAAAALALAACGKAPPENRGEGGPANRIVNDFPPPPEQTRPPETQFGPEEAMAGTWTTRFEHSDFNNCWFEMAPEALAEFRRLYPTDSADAPQNGRSYRLRILGRRSVPPATGPASYGHLGGWRCEIRATRILSAEVIGGDHLTVRIKPDGTLVDPDVARAREAAGDVRPAFSEGHDRARLEDQRRNMPPVPR
jgi:hypothetical protein